MFLIELKKISFNLQTIFFFQGFTDNRDTLWQEMCGAQKNALTDPYLRAAFSFLTSTSEKFEAVLVNK